MSAARAPSDVDLILGLTARDIVENRLATSDATRNSPKIAREVFDVADLMEQILLHLNTVDVLHAMQATRAMRDTVLGSSKIQKRIGLIPDTPSDFYIPLSPPCPMATWPVAQVGQTFNGLILDVLSPTFSSSRGERYPARSESQADNAKGLVFSLEIRSGKPSCRDWAHALETF